MTTLVTRQAPDFTAEAVFPNDQIKPATLSSFRGKYVVLLFYPMDFTFVCPTEILAFHRQIKDFESRNTLVFGISCDSVYSHFAWKQRATAHGGIGAIDFPLISDITKNIARDYGILYNESVALRGLFLIDREGIVRHATINDLPLGRNVAEILRTIDALQFYEKHGEVCPANWRDGDEAITPSPDGIANYLTKHA